MKKTFLLCLLSLSAFATNKNNRYNIVPGTNSISLCGSRYPLNNIILQINLDSIRVQFFNVNTSGNGMMFSPITQLDSYSHYTLNGGAFTSVSQIDSYYQAKFVK